MSVTETLKDADGNTIYVTIELPKGKWFEGRCRWHGPVISKANYRKGPGEPDCWYVEFIDEQWGYCYIKQDSEADGAFKDATFTYTLAMHQPLNGRVV